MIFVNVDVPMQRWPFANWALIAITVFFSIAAWVQVNKQGIDHENLLIPPEIREHLDDTRLSDDEKVAIIAAAAKREAIYYHYPGSLDNRQFLLGQLITYQFVHGSFWHLLGNMLFLFAFGNAVNSKLGHVAYLVLYLGLGVFAGLGWMLIDRGGGQLIGASGAIAGVTGLFFVLYPFNECSVYHPQIFNFTRDAWRVPSWAFILVFMAFDLWGTLRTDDAGGGVAYAAHLAGEFAGVGIAIGLVKTGLVNSVRGEKNLCEHLNWVKPGLPKQRRRRSPLVRRPQPRGGIE